MIIRVQNKERDTAFAMSLSVVGGPTAFTGTPDALSGVMFRVMTPLFH